MQRRKMLGALGLTLAAGFPASAAPAAKSRAGHMLYPDVASMLQDKKTGEGTLVQTAGYFTPGDGGAATYRYTNAGGYSLIPDTSVNYKMFGAVSDGKNDDGVQIKAAHEFANLHNIPVINHGGEFWIRQTTGIPVLTNVHWGQTVFHIDEQYNARSSARFEVKSRQQPQQISLDAAAKADLLKQLKPGVKLLPMMAPYTNCLVFIADEKDRIGLRAGEKYTGQSWAREDFFYVEEHGRLTGDLAWSFKDYTSLYAVPCEDKYLVIEGGTFYVTGNSPGKVNGAKYDGYWRSGIHITRSRTIVRQQWVGLAPGAKDVAMNPRGGFYSMSKVYDVTLQDIRLIPWEQDREGTDRDVPAGTYGLSCNRTLKARFIRVTAEGGPVHWGVFGTNLNKHFYIDQCALNRVDVHFHCWHLHIKDSSIGYRGITVTGGGDLFVENTTVWSRNFLSFRRDFGAKWDGAIYVRNCRYIPSVAGETAVLEFNPADSTYNYPIGFGRTIRVDGLVIDYSSVPSSGRPCWLMRMPSFSRMKSGDHMFFPHFVSFRDIVVEGRAQGVRLLQIPTPQDYRQPAAGGFEGGQLTPNASLVFDQVHLERAEGLTIGSGVYTDAHALYPELRIVNCHHFAATIKAAADLRVERSEVNGLQLALQGSLALADCKLRAGEQGMSVKAEGGAGFTNCTVYAPLVNGRPAPELTDRYGFIQLNEAVRFNHLNTRLGADIMEHCRKKGIALLPKFISMLQGHHELEKETV